MSSEVAQIHNEEYAVGGSFAETNTSQIGFSCGDLNRNPTPATRARQYSEIGLYMPASGLDKILTISSDRSNQNRLLDDEIILDNSGEIGFVVADDPYDIEVSMNSADNMPGLSILASYFESYSPQTRAYLKPLANRELIDRLEELRQSGETYVYPGGRRPVEAAFEDARRFLENLPELVRKPTITLVIDGEINFSWEYGDLYIDLGFYGDGEGGSYFAEDRYGREYGIDSFDPSTLPDEILRLITS